MNAVVVRTRKGVRRPDGSLINPFRWQRSSSAERKQPANRYSYLWASDS